MAAVLAPLLLLLAGSSHATNMNPLTYVIANPDGAVKRKGWKKRMIDCQAVGRE